MTRALALPSVQAVHPGYARGLLPDTWAPPNRDKFHAPKTKRIRDPCSRTPPQIDKFHVPKLNASVTHALNSPPPNDKFHVPKLDAPSTRALILSSIGRLLLVGLRLRGIETRDLLPHSSACRNQLLLSWYCLDIILILSLHSSICLFFKVVFY